MITRGLSLGHLFVARPLGGQEMPQQAEACTTNGLYWHVVQPLGCCEVAEQAEACTTCACGSQSFSNSNLQEFIRDPRRWAGLVVAGFLGLSMMMSFAAEKAVSSTHREPDLPSTNWPMFRGSPALRGVSVSPLPEALALRWTFKTEDEVKSSAAIVDGRVFVGSADTNVYALELNTGRMIWAAKTGGAVESSPLVRQGKVFVGSSDGFLYALDAATGKQLWKYETGDRILGAPNWVRCPTNDSLWILVGSYDFKLHCVAADTGKAVWTFESGNYINGAPAVADGVAIFGGCDAQLHVINLADGKEIKAIEAGAYIPASAAIVGEEAYFGHYENALLAVDWHTGKVRWTYKDKAFPFFSSPAVGASRVVIGGRNKGVVCVNRSDGQLLWKFATRGQVDSSPVICGDRVVAASEDGRLYILWLADGTLIWSYDLGKPITASPAVAAGWIVIGCEDGNVYGFSGKK
jgi:eukaryotic-like serine/threonine-protein kinase